MWHAWEMRGKCTGFWWESRKERDHLEERGVDGRMGMDLGETGFRCKNNNIYLSYAVWCLQYLCPLMCKNTKQSLHY
jgi:hypothetical protein